MKVVSVAVITFDNTVKNNVLGFGDYAFTLIYSVVFVISFQTREIDNKILTYLNTPCSNTVCSLLVYVIVTPLAT
jgi:hypothetical protein